MNTLLTARYFLHLLQILKENGLQKTKYDANRLLYQSRVTLVSLPLTLLGRSKCISRLAQQLMAAIKI